LAPAVLIKAVTYFALPAISKQKNSMFRPIKSVAEVATDSRVAFLRDFVFFKPNQKLFLALPVFMYKEAGITS
jgi:hypothetical protein